MAIHPCIISGGIIFFILSRTLIRRSAIFAFEVSAYFNTRYNRNEPQFIGFLGTSINYYYNYLTSQTITYHQSTVFQ